MREKRRWTRSGARALWPVLFAALAGGTVILAPGSTENAKANGDTRTIYLHHAHTRESIAATFMVDGQYDSGVLEKLNWFLRDWRRDEPTKMDPRLFDVIWTVYRESGSAQPIEVMSAYRSPETNAMLRRRSRAVAEHSQHILGKAMDQHYVDVPMSRIREIAMKLQRGGVGFYPTAGTPFVHMDVGGVRHWPRMSYDQLSRLFPDGKTVHIPSNGQPLPGYEEARAELESRGDSFNYPTATEVKSKGFFAWLFGGGDEEEDAASAQAGSGRRGQTRVASLAPIQSTVVQPAGSFSSSSKDAGVHAFNLASAAPPPSFAGALPRGQLAPQSPPTQQAALDRPVVAERPDPRAERALALAMAEQQRAAQDPSARAQASVEAVPPTVQPAPDQPLAGPVPEIVAPTISANAASPLASVPVPPRRPVELASGGPAAPLPPGRPAGIASLPPNDRASGVPAPKRNTIEALIAMSAPARTAGLPAVITHGAGGAKPAGAPPQVLAFAAPTAVAVLPDVPARAPVPMPTPRPSFVAARLDRSNFDTLTGSTKASRSSVRSGLGSAVAALRPAARANLGTLAGQASPGALHSFAVRATDLPTDHFSGSATKPREHVVTFNGGTSSRPSPD